MAVEKTRTDMSAYHLGASPDVYEIQRSNGFKLIVTDLDPLTNPVTGELIPNASDILKQSVFSAEPPSFSQQPIEVRLGNTVVKTAGTPTYSDTSIGLHDYVGLETYNVLLAWQALSFNIKTQRVGLAGDYKKTAYLLEYSPDFAKITRVWKLYGVWITSLKKDGFDNSASAQEVKIQCTISYDWAEPEDPNQL